MLKVQILILIIIFSLKGYTQFSSLLNTHNKDRVGFMLEKDNNLYYTYKSFNDKTSEFINAYNGNISYILKYNIENGNIDTINLKSTSNNIKEFNFNILIKEDTLLAFYSSQEDSNFRNLSFLKIYNNTIVDDVQLNINNDSIDFNYSTILNYKNNFIVLASQVYTTDSYYIYELDLKGNLINQLHINQGFMTTINQLADSSYILTNQLYGYSKVDKNLDSINSIPLPFHKLIAKSINSTDSTTFIAGTHDILNVIEPDYQGEFLYEINTYTDKIDTLYMDTLYSGINNTSFSSFKGFDRKYIDYLYMSNNIDNCPLFWNYQDCQSFITIYSFKENGDIRWSKLLGGDASYYSWQVVALKDTGVFLYANRYSPIDNPNQEEDVYYMKFDKDGNIDSDFFNPITGIKEQIIPIVDILIYPNPNEGIFNIVSTDIKKEYTIRVYTIQGQQIIEKIIHNKDTIDITKFSNGLYLYQIIYEDKIIKNGKIEKGN